MVKTTIPMSQKEIREGRRAGIPENLISRMARGLELTERERDTVRNYGKVYVVSHIKNEGQTSMKPQLRDSPKIKLGKEYDKYLIRRGLGKGGRKEVWGETLIEGFWSKTPVFEKDGSLKLWIDRYAY